MEENKRKICKFFIPIKSCLEFQSLKKKRVKTPQTHCISNLAAVLIRLAVFAATLRVANQGVTHLHVLQVRSLARGW